MSTELDKARGAIARYYSHTNRHPDEYGNPWGWITASPEWQAAPIAYWGGRTGRVAMAVATGSPQAGLDIRAPWTVRGAPKRMSWDVPEWCVVNADGVVVLNHIKNRDVAAVFVNAAAAFKETP